MNTDEVVIKELQSTIKHLRAKIEKLETCQPHGSALKVFNSFWKEHNRLGFTSKELASLAFDAGHKLRHEKESK